MHLATLPNRLWGQWIVIATTACLAVFVWEALSDEPPAADRPHRVPVALVDIAQVWKQFRDFNLKMNGIKGAIEEFEKEVRVEQVGIQRLIDEGAVQENSKSADELKQLAASLEAKIALKKQSFFDEETRVYFGTYQRVTAVVEQLARQRDIGVVLRFNSDPVNPADRESVLQGVNRAVIHSNVPDLTEDVVSILNGRKL